MAVPVPSATTDVSDLLNGGEDASSVDQIVSLVAGDASTVSVVGVALVRNRHADSVVVEDPVIRALDTNLLVPVPGGTADIRNFLDGGEDTGTIDEVVSLVASNAGTLLVVSVALIRDWDTDTVVVQDPVVGALETGSFVPIPGGASYIGDLFDGSKNALSADKIVANVAAEAGTISIESVALI